MLLLFRDSNRREQNRSIVQHHHREHDRDRKLHQRHRHGKRNEVLHEAQHPRTSSTSYARTSKPVATRHTVITPVRQSITSKFDSYHTSSQTNSATCDSHQHSIKCKARNEILRQRGCRVADEIHRPRDSPSHHPYLTFPYPFCPSALRRIR